MMMQWLLAALVIVVVGGLAWLEFVGRVPHVAIYDLALYQDATTIDAVELNPQFAHLVSNNYADFAGHIYQTPGVSLHTGEARSFTVGSAGDYDLIQVSLLDAFSASASGQYSLSENHLYTIEALGEELSIAVVEGDLEIVGVTWQTPR